MSLPMIPATAKNRIMFVIYLFSLNLLFAMVSPFEVEIEKAPGRGAEGLLENI